MAGPFPDRLRFLSEDDQEVLRLTTWEGLGPADAAAVLGCPTAAVKVRLHRARQRLRKALGQAEASPQATLARSSSTARPALTDVPPSRSKETR